MQEKIKSWLGKHPLKVGREVLVKYVAHTIPS
jgi:hypothetical protein